MCKTLFCLELPASNQSWVTGLGDGVDLEDDMADIGVLDFASLLEEVAAVWASDWTDSTRMDALQGLLDAVDTE